LGRIGDVRAIEPLAATLKQYDQTNPKPTKTELRDLLNVPKFGSQNQENDWVRGELETMYATDAAKAIQEAIHRIESHAPSPGTSVSERLPVPTQPQLQPTPAPPKAATPVTGKCDICTQVINRSDGYVLTTRQVVTEMAYWLHVLKNQGKSFRVGDLKTEMQLINGFAMEQAASATGWLVCEQCSSMFKFDRVVARQCAVSGEQPPGAGPADARDVMTKAVYARTMLEG